MKAGYIKIVTESHGIKMADFEFGGTPGMFEVQQDVKRFAFVPKKGG